LITPADALVVLAHIKLHGSGEGEGESAVIDAAAAPLQWSAPLANKTNQPPAASNGEARRPIRAIPNITSAQMLGPAPKLDDLDWLESVANQFSQQFKVPSDLSLLEWLESRDELFALD
jgi:hypothetical protein